MPAAGARSSTLSGEAVRRILLTPERRRYIEETFVRTHGEPPAGAPSSSSAPDRRASAGDDEAIADDENPNSEDNQARADPTRAWVVLYDTRLFVLARRGCCLREREGSFELQVDPSSACSEGLLQEEAPLAPPQAKSKPRQTSEMIVGPEAILRRLGPDPSPEDGGLQDRPFPGVLARRGVRPFARLRSEHCFFGAELRGPMGGPASRLMISLEHSYFDTTYAEPAAIAMLLTQTNGVDLREENLQVTFAEFRVVDSTPRAGASRPAVGKEADRDAVDFFLRTHHLDSCPSGGSREGTSLVSAYLVSCRPAHLRMLQDAGIAVDPGPDEASDTGSAKESASGGCEGWGREAEEWQDPDHPRRPSNSSADDKILEKQPRQHCPTLCLCE